MSSLLGVGGVDWLKCEVIAVSDDNVTANLTSHFQNGTETLDTLVGDLDTGDGNLSMLPTMLLMAPLIVKSNLNVGDLIPGLGENVGSTVSQVYAGHRRDINCYELVISSSGVSMGSYYYYDKSTGFLCETVTNSSISILNYTTSYSASMTINETNFFTDQIHDITIENVLLSPANVYVGSVVNVTVLVKNEGNEGETFELAANWTELGQANSTQIGQQQIVDLANGSSESVQFEWNASGLSVGTYSLEAVSSLQDEVNMGNNTFVLEPLNIQKAPPNQPLALYVVIGVAVVLILAVALYFRKNRKDKAKTKTESATPTVQDQQPVT
jgi:hypothetical protein